MVYVFYVNRGTFITFDDKITSDSVGGLKQALLKRADIPIKTQVILVSGGYEPVDRVLVGECNAGLEDNNPIYLYRRVESDSQPNESVSPQLVDVSQLQERVSSLLNVQPSYKTVRQRVQLAKDFCEHSRLQVETVRRLVKEQHMMSQGWYVALANLDEMCSRIRRRYDEFCRTWEQYMKDRPAYQHLVDNFEEVVDMLERIHLPDGLVQSCCDVAHMSVSSITASQVAALKEFQSEREQKSTRVSLLDWLNSFDKRGSLAHVLSKVRLTLERLNDSVAGKISVELPESLGLANENSQEHRVVQGLEQRLSQMSHYQSKAEGRCRNQHELMTTLAANLERLEKERDASVIGELCKQHKRYLVTLGENHKKQTEAVQFALNGKNDFMHNLHMRFLWLTRIEMMLSSQESYFQAVCSRLRELDVHTKVLSQAKVAASLYAQTLTELVRRREFAETYSSWSGDVVDLATDVHRQEVAHREQAVKRLDNHFLWCLFRSMKRMPSKFATKRPLCVDKDLPALTRADLDELRSRVPELASYLSLPHQSLAHLDALGHAPSSCEDANTQTEEIAERACFSEEEEVFSSALLNLESSRRSEGAQTDVETWREGVWTQLAQLQDEAVPELRQALSEVSARMQTEAEIAHRQAEEVKSTVKQLQTACQLQVDNEREKLTREKEEEKETLCRRVAEAESALALAHSRLSEAMSTADRRVSEAEMAASLRLASEKDALSKALLLEHEVALEAERGRHASVLAERTAALREAERQAEWHVERLNSVTKERDLLERAAAAEKAMLEAEVARLKEEARGVSRRRRMSISGDSPQHEVVRRFSVATINTDSADEAELLEVEEVWPRQESRDDQQEKIADLETQLQQRDNLIADLQRTVDRMSQQAIRDREYIRTLRSEPGRAVLSSSPQMVGSSRSPPVLEQPGPIASSFMLMSSTETAPVTCPPRSVLGAPGVQASSSMTESAISSVSVAASTPPKPLPASPGAMGVSTSSSSPLSQRALKIVLSQFRSGDRVLLLRNPTTGLWFMLSTDGWSYFVHSDCFCTLELDTDRFYTVAEFKSKERCLARKDRNRFALPAGNYFFRIKARPLRDAPGQAWPGQTPMAGLVSEPSRGEEE